LREALTDREYWVRNLRQFRCPDCGSLVGYRSRRRTMAEKYILPLLLLQPVRCGDCFCRFYRPVSVQVRERKELGHRESGIKIPQSPQTGSRVA